MDKDMQLFIVAGVVALALIVIVVRIAGDRYEKSMPSGDVTAAYENARVDPAKNYYISGSEAVPNAIIGIDRTWTLESDLWKITDLDSAKLKESVRNMQQFAGGGLNVLQGFTIYDNRGDKIGDWFSVPGLTMTVKITGDRRAAVYTPPIDTYRQP